MGEASEAPPQKVHTANQSTEATDKRKASLNIVHIEVDANREPLSTVQNVTESRAEVTEKLMKTNKDTPEDRMEGFEPSVHRDSRSKVLRPKGKSSAVPLV